MAKIEFTDKSLQNHIKNTVLSLNPEELAVIYTYISSQSQNTSMFTGFNCDAIADSLIDGQNSNTITGIPTENLTRSFPVLYEPRFLSYSPVASSTISKIL